MKQHSGKKIVPLVYGSAVLLCAGLLWYGLSIRGLRANAPLGAEDRAILAGLPREWTRLTNVEGQGWSIYIPCNSEAGTLVIEAQGEDPRLTCAYCDSVQGATIRRVALTGVPPHPVRLKLDGGGSVFVEPVEPAVSARFTGARLQDYVMTWTLEDGTEMYFIPTVTSRNFEFLRAEDESPEGCGE
jgi:hypothetical protein